MKRLLFYFFFVALFLCARESYSINIARRYGCDTLLMKGNYTQLKQLEAVILNEIQKGGTNVSNANVYALMGDVQVTLGNYKKASEWYRKGIDAFAGIDFSLEGNHTEKYYYAQCLYSFANLQAMMGWDSGEIIDNYDLSLDMIMEYYKGDLAEMEQSLADYANLLGQMVMSSIFLHTRDYAQAVDSCNEYLRKLESLFADKAEGSFEYANALCMIADAYEKGNNYERALEYFNKARGLIENVCGKNSVYYATITGRIGGIYYALNDLVEAGTYYVSSIALFVDAGFKEHSELAVSYSGMGMVLLNLRKSSDSYSYFMKAHTMQSKLCGKNTFRALVTKQYLAYPLVQIGKYDQAISIMKELIDNKILMGNLSSDSYLNCLVFATDIHLITKKYTEVVDIYKDFDQLCEALGNVSRYTKRNLYLNVGRAYKRMGQLNNVVEPFEKVIDLQRAIAHDNFSFLTEKQRTKAWDVDNTRIKSVFSINMAEQQEAGGVADVLYDMALLNKGILLQASINLAEVIYNSGDAGLKEDFDRYRLYKQTFEAKGEGKANELENMERDIVKKAKVYGDFMEYTSITWEDVKRCLGDNDVAIEFIASEYLGQVTYSAEIIRKEMEAPVHIKLFTIPSNQVTLLNAPDGEFSTLIKKHLWNRKLRDYMEKGENVFFVPDGELYNIGIEYIPLPGGERMCDVYKMHRLSSTREIVNTNEPVATNTCVLFGGLNYNTSLSDMELYAYASSIRGGKTFEFSPDKSAGYSSWGYLPGTLDEVNSISSTLGGKGYSVSTFTGSEGVEESFKALSGRKTEIIHIATHGFYMPDKGDALQNSGLVFAGANNFWNGALGPDVKSFDDGILTAKEISHLNLQGTDLVVMSACQTGLGKVTGEGVFGLQRAFKKAGVQTLLMSLWEVDDEATQMMMSEFYSALAQGQSKYQALESAQAKIREHTFLRNGKKVSGNDLFYWGSFIMVD